MDNIQEYFLKQTRKQNTLNRSVAISQFPTISQVAYLFRVKANELFKYYYRFCSVWNSYAAYIFNIILGIVDREMSPHLGYNNNQQVIHSWILCISPMRMITMYGSEIDHNRYYRIILFLFFVSHELFCIKVFIMR